MGHHVEIAVCAPWHVELVRRRRCAGHASAIAVCPQWCPALRRRWAPQNNSCAFHRMWNTTRGSLRSRSAAKSCASPCSTSVIGGQKHELDAIVYFDLLFRFSCPQQFQDRWLGVAGHRATRNTSSCNQSGADASRSFCGPTPVQAPSQRSHCDVENVAR